MSDPPHNLLHYIQHIASVWRDESRADAELLDSFAIRRDEARVRRLGRPAWTAGLVNLQEYSPGECGHRRRISGDVSRAGPPRRDDDIGISARLALQDGQPSQLAIVAKRLSPRAPKQSVPPEYPPAGIEPCRFRCRRQGDPSCWRSRKNSGRLPERLQVVLDLYLPSRPLPGANCQDCRAIRTRPSGDGVLVRGVQMLQKAASSSRGPDRIGVRSCRGFSGRISQCGGSCFE